MLIALCFKVAVAPFHIWTPDVYEGAPTPVTGFMSVGPKAAGFAVLFRVFLTAFPSIQDRWASAIWLIAALTMVLGQCHCAGSAEHQAHARLFIDRACRICRGRLRRRHPSEASRPRCSTCWRTA